MFDYYYYLLNIAPEQESEENAGLLVMLPNRKADRKRMGDTFFALLSFEGNLDLSASQQNSLLEKAAEKYFTSSGSVTAGMRAAAEPINEFLYSRNLRNTNEGKQLVGILNMGVFHGGVAIIAHAGTTHTFFLTKANADDNWDPGAGRGLGLSRSISLRFFQQTIETGDVILFSPQPPSTWTPAQLAGAPQLNRDVLRRRLLNQVSGKLRAAVIHFQAGNGELHPLRLRSTQTQTAPQQQPAEKFEPRPQATPIRVATDTVVAPSVSSDITPKPGTPVTQSASIPPVMAHPSSGETETPQVQLPRKRRSGIKRMLSSIFTTSRKTQKQVDGGVRQFVGRVLPEKTDQLPKLSTATMLFIAIAIPVLVVALATTIYIRSGRDEQHNALVYLAQQSAEKATSISNAVSRTTAWQDVITQLDEAEKYGQSQTSQQLRNQAQQALDQLQGIRRLDFKDAMAGNFDTQVQLTQIVAVQSGDLYGLDALHGRVIHLKSSQNGYVLDRSFICGPGQVGSLIVGPLVDIVSLPRNNLYNADILGIDATGTLIICRSGEKATTDATALPSEQGWGKITAINLFGESLYVLDPTNNVVWRFDSLSDNFADPPHPLEITVQNMFNTVDLAMYEDDLFLLHADGTTTRCTYRSPFTTEMECKEPALYTITDADQNRLTYESIAHTAFSQIQATYPLEPSLYILDQGNGSIFRFSMALQMQYQMQPTNTSSILLPATTATAFAVTYSQEVVLAYNDQLFIAALPLP